MIDKDVICSTSSQAHFHKCYQYYQSHSKRKREKEREREREKERVRERESEKERVRERVRKREKEREREREKTYRAFHRFVKAKFLDCGSVLSSSQFSILPQLPLIN